MSLLSSLVVAATVVASLLAPAFLKTQAPLLLAVGFVIGLPHGAVDHLVPFWRRHGPATLGQMMVLLVAYVASAGATWLALQRAAPVVLPVMLVVSVLHFGAGDLMTAPPRTHHRIQPRAARTVHVIARGGPILAGPLAWWPQQTATALSGLDPATAVLVRELTWPIVVVVLVCVVVDLLWSWRERDLKAAIDTALIASLFSVAPPTAAFGVYFGAWHGARHTARLIESNPRNTTDLARHCYTPPLARFVRAAAVPTLIALSAVTILVLLTTTHQDLSRPIFLLLFALTVPHMLIVARMDHSPTTSAPVGHVAN